MIEPNEFPWTPFTVLVGHSSEPQIHLADWTRDIRERLRAVNVETHEGLCISAAQGPVHEDGWYVEFLVRHAFTTTHALYEHVHGILEEILGVPFNLDGEFSLPPGVHSSLTDSPGSWKPNPGEDDPGIL